VHLLQAVGHLLEALAQALLQRGVELLVAVARICSSFFSLPSCSATSRASTALRSSACDVRWLPTTAAAGRPAFR